MVEAIKEQNLICPGCTGNNLNRSGFSTIWKAHAKTRVQRYRCQDCGLLTTKPSTDHDVNILDQKHQLLCLRCDHKWESLNAHPRQCPKCHSGYWDRPKKKENVDAPVIIHDVNRVEPEKP